MTHLLRISLLFCTATLLGVALGPAPSHGQDAPFITIWDTENPGVTDDDQIKIPGTGTDYQIIWEEVGNTSNTDTLTATDVVTVTFPNPGVYRVKISGDFTQIQFAGSGDPRKVVLVEQWGDIEWSTMFSAFEGASSLDISSEDTPDLSRVTRMDEMFSRASSLTASNSNISSWNTSNVEDMSWLFYRAINFNKNLDDWDTSNVVNMVAMFAGEFENPHSFNGEIKNWDVSNVEDMYLMFSFNNSFNRDISVWNTTSLTDMEEMFRGASSFNRDIGGWDTGQVTDLSQTFEGASSFNKDIGKWDTGNVTSMWRMFFGASSFNHSLGRWEVSGVESGPFSGMSTMLSGASLSKENYDRTILGWSMQNLNSQVELDGASFCNSGPFRDHIVEAFDWTINDSQSSGCPNVLAASDANEVTGDGTFAFDDTGLNMTVSGLLGGDRVTAARFSDPPRNAGGIPEDNVSQFRVVIAGGGITFFDSTKVQFAVSELGGIDQPEDVTIYKRPQPGHGAFDSLATSVDDNGTPSDISDDTLSATVTSSSGEDGFGEFVFASDTNELPVELASFDGTTTEEGVRLTWKTTSETGNAGFQIQRETETSGWKQLGYVESKTSSGSTSEANSYEYTVEDLPVGTHRFRLKQVDVDGSSTIHGPITAKVRMKEALMLTAPAPNPAQGSATFFFAVKEEARATVNVYNMLGQQVATLYDGMSQAGERQRLQVDASTLPSGTYFVRLKSGGKTTTRQLTVVR